MNETAALVALVTIFVLGIGAQWIAWSIRVPSIILLLLFGFLAGQTDLFQETALLDPDLLLGPLLQPLVSLSVGIILFEGSLTLRLTDLREIGRPLGNLLTIGVLVTWVLAGLGAFYVLGFNISNAILIGALLTVTGPTVIVPLLLYVRPTGRAGPVAKWEGIVIDPIGAVLAVLVYEAAAPIQDAALATASVVAIEGAARTLLIGGAFGIGSAILLGFLLKRYWIPDQLQSAVALTFVVLAFSLSNLLQHESGLLTVTLMGVLLANQREIVIRPILEFKENLTVLLISTLFILLTARLELDSFQMLSWRGPAFVAYLILVVRPVAVWLSSLGTKLTKAERIFLAFLAPRGIVAAAVASVFALHSDYVDPALVPATFMTIIVTVTFYGLIAAPLARRLGLATPNPQGVLIASAHAGSRAIASALKNQGIVVRLVDTNRWNIKSARLEGLSTSYADILSETVEERLDLGGIGRFLALTPNDEVNSLATLSMTEIFGRTNVYQLPRQQAREPVSTGRKNPNLQGRVLFDETLDYAELDRRFAAGAKIKSTKLTKEFTIETLRSTYDDSMRILFVITEDGQLIINAVNEELSFKAGQTVITIANPLPRNGRDSAILKRGEKTSPTDTKDAPS